MGAVYLQVQCHRLRQGRVLPFLKQVVETQQDALQVGAGLFPGAFRDRRRQ